MALETFARQSLTQFIIIYAELYEEGKVIKPAELDIQMWARMCAKDAGVTKIGFKIPYDNIKRAKVTLPYMPADINYTGCPVIKKNGGLYTPCCGKIAEGEITCKSCGYDKEGNEKKQEFGTTDDRETNVADGLFAPVTFAEWMKGHKTTLPEVYGKLSAAGISLEVPVAELVCREVPKRRKGRPAKSEDDVVDADSVSDAQVKKATKPKAKAPKATKPKAESESESESEKKVTKAKKEKKTKKTSESESESEKKVTKAKKEKKEKIAKAESESESEKKAKTEKKEKKEKKEKAESDTEKPKKSKKPKADSDSEEEKPDNKNTNELEEAEFEEEDQEIEIDGEQYILRNGKFICNDAGTILGTMDDEGYPVWKSDAR
jgi:hypothetical protein